MQSMHVFLDHLISVLSCQQPLNVGECHERLRPGGDLIPPRAWTTNRRWSFFGSKIGRRPTGSMRSWIGRKEGMQLPMMTDK